jgi:hypothetical protein
VRLSNGGQPAQGVLMAAGCGHCPPPWVGDWHWEHRWEAAYLQRAGFASLQAPLV